MASLGEAVVDVGANTSGFRSEVEAGVQSALSSASKSMKNVGKDMTRVGKSLTLSVTAPIVGIGVAAVKTAGDFEQSMNTLSAATGIAGKPLDALQKQAISLGADTVFSANEAADAMLELGKSGFKAAQITKAVPQVLNLAATEGLGLAESAGIVTSALAQFGLKAGDSAQVVNALAGASNASRSSVASLSESFKLVGSAASSVGLSVQETAGALAALSQAGLDGSIAGTSLAAVFNHLVPVTKKAQKAMSDLHLDFTNADGSFKNIDQIAQELQTTFQGMSQEQRKIKIGAIFGRDASTIAAVNALISAGGKGLRSYTKAAMDQSAAQKLADARMKGVRGSLEKMKGSLETAALVIGQAMIPVVEKVATFIGDMADRFGQLNPNVQRAILIAAGFAAALGPVLIVVGTLITSIGAIAGVFGAMSLAVVAPIAAVVALGAAIGILLYKSKDARKVMVDAFNQVKAAVLPAIQGISDMVTQQLIPAFQKIWPILGPVLQKIAMVFLQVFSGTVVSVIRATVAVVSGAFQILTGIVQVFAAILTGDFGAAWQGVKNIFSGAITIITGLFKSFLYIGLIAPVKMAMAVITGAFSLGWTAVKNIVSRAMAAVRSAVSSGINSALGFVRSMPGRIRGLAGDFLSAGKHIGSQVIKGIGNGLKAAGSFVSDLAGSIKNAINSALHLPFTIHGPGPLPDFKIPAFAGGTLSAPGGAALVGERGRELVALPRGSRVYPNHTTERMLGNDGPMDLSDATIAALAAAILAGARIVSQATTAASWKDETESIFT